MPGIDDTDKSLNIKEYLTKNQANIIPVLIINLSEGQFGLDARKA